MWICLSVVLGLIPFTLGQYRSHFFVTEKKWYENNVLTFGSSTVKTIDFRSVYTRERAWGHCSRLCSVETICESFAVYQINGPSVSFWRCRMWNHNICNTQAKYLMSADVARLWDRVAATPNNAVPCINQKPGMTSSDYRDYCPYVRPTCAGTSCTICPKTCAECYSLYNRTFDYAYDCWIWPEGNVPMAGPPPFPTRCYGAAQYVMRRLVNTSTGNDVLGSTFGMPTQTNYNWTRLQKAWTTSYQQVVLRFGCQNPTQPLYEARYSNFRILADGTLNMIFVGGNAGDGFGFGSNTVLSTAYPYVYPVNPTPCGSFWNLAQDSNCPGGEGVRFWGTSNIAVGDYGIRWPGLSSICNISSFSLLFM